MSTPTPVPPPAAAPAPPNKIKLFFREAFTKVTTYIALGIAGCSQFADHAEDLRSQWPQLLTFLPSSPVIDKFSHYAISVLGIAVVYTRVRRLLKSAP